jgi:hypothetical protein
MGIEKILFKFCLKFLDLNVSFTLLFFDSLSIKSNKVIYTGVSVSLLVPLPRTTLLNLQNLSVQYRYRDPPLVRISRPCTDIDTPIIPISRCFNIHSMAIETPSLARSVFQPYLTAPLVVKIAQMSLEM